MTKTIPKVLLVEDDAESREAMVRIRRTAGYKVAETDNAENALEMIARHSTNVLITDLQLPGMDGIELLKVRSWPHQKSKSF